MGITVDEETGKTIYNPGLRSEVLINEGTAQHNMIPIADTPRTFPIPNEKQTRLLTAASSSAPDGLIRIGQNMHPLTLPFKVPGLIWKGQLCVTTSQLQSQTQSIIKKRRPTDTNSYK